MKQYNPVLKKADPFVNIQLPKTILADLTLRSVENGASLNMEIARRLARTLERDLAMIQEDYDTAYLAFQMHEQLKENQNNGGSRNV